MNPTDPQALYQLAVQAFQSSQIRQASDLFARAAAVDPNNANLRSDLALTLNMLGRFDQAIAAASSAIQLNPNLHEAYNNLGNALREKGRLEDAAAAMQKAIQLRPDYFQAHTNLGYVCELLRDFDAAAEAYRTTIRLRPDFAGAYNNLGNVVKEQGDVVQAVECYRKAFTLDPRFVRAYDNFLYMLYYHPGYSPDQILQEHKIWNQRYAEPLARSIRAHPNDRNPNRKLRIGYVSPDFFSHCQSLYTIPLLTNHDRKNFEITCYASVRKPDAMTARLQSLADRWRDISAMNDDQAAELIRADQIDILVDLTLHMSDNRLMIFARKPAPVQVTWLGYPGTTGLRTMDYRMTDPYLDPPGTDSRYTERSIRLPDCFWCYDPLSTGPTVNELPAMTNGHITFGCLNNFCKVTDDVLQTWARILVAVENSRLIILAAPGLHRQRLTDRMAQLGVESSRIEFVAKRPREQYLELYHRLDISLDTFPVNGHTTSLDSLWMGVPVVTLAGSTAIARAGLCQLSLLGLQELVAHSKDDYIKIAIELATDFPRLARLRSALRPTLRACPLMDAPRFARNIETAYRQMWRNGCNADNL